MMYFLSQRIPGVLNGGLAVAVLAVFAKILFQPEYSNNLALLGVILILFYWMCASYAIKYYRRKIKELEEIISSTKTVLGHVGVEKNLYRNIPVPNWQEEPPHVKNFWESHPELK